MHPRSVLRVLMHGGVHLQGKTNARSRGHHQWPSPSPLSQLPSSCTCVSVCLFVCLSVCPSVCMSACLPVCLSVCLSLSLCPSLCLRVCLCLYVCCFCIFTEPTGRQISSNRVSQPRRRKQLRPLSSHLEQAGKPTSLPPISCDIVSS